MAYLGEMLFKQINIDIGLKWTVISKVVHV